MKPFRLTIQHLTKAYGSVPVWNDVSLELSSGQSYCLMGPSGCGKTTFLRILLGLEQADGGSILVTYPGQSASITLAASPLCGAMSAVFQEDRLCEEFSPLHNVMLTADRHLNRRQVYGELCRLLPEESVLRPVSTLSGGMKRRVAILRAMLAPSSAILMDEPFTGLDEETKDRVIAYIKEKAAGRLLLVSTHQEEDISSLNASLLRLIQGA